MPIFTSWFGNAPADPHKISAPEPVSCLSRQRLFKHLDAGRHALIWVHSPAGAGKSVLAADYARRHQLPVLWYALDWRDEDLASFFHHFRLAAVAAFGEADDKLPPFGPIYAEGIDAYASQYFSHLFAAIQSPTLLVLDNYERLSAAHPLHALLARQVETTRPGLRWMILSREAAPTPYSPVAKQELDWAQLQLTLSESRALLKMRGITEPKRIDELHALAGGWAAVLDLLAADNAEAHQHNADFADLADAMLARLPEAQRRLLLILALLPSFTAADAQQLGEPDNAARLLAAIARNHPMIDLVKDKVPRFQIHALLREHLLARLPQEMLLDQLQLVQRKAADLLAMQDDIDEAAALFQASASWPQLADLILRHARRYESSGRERMLQRWLAALPREMIDTDPWLLHWWAVSIATGDSEAALRHLEAAFDMFVARRDSHGAYAVFTAAVSSISFTLHDFTPLHDWLPRYDLIRNRLPRCLDLELRLRAAAASIMAMTVTVPNHPRLHRLARWGEYLMRLLPLRHIRVIVGGQLAHFYAFTGQNAKLHAVTDRMEADLDDPQLPPLPRIHAQAMLGLARYISGHPGAEEAHRKCLSIAKTTGVHVLDTLAQGILIDYCLHRNELDEVQRRLQTMRASLVRTRKYDTSHLEYVTGWLATLRGEVPRAIEHIRQAKLLSLQVKHPFSADVTRALLVQLYADQAEWQNAERELAEIHASIKDADLHVARLLCLQSETWLALRQQDLPRALRSLRAAFKLGSDTQSIGQLNWRHDVGLALCTLALEHDIETDYAIRLIRHYMLQPDEPPLHLECWPWPVRIYTLGRFAITLDGEALQDKGKVQKRPLELLKAMIALGGRSVPEGQLVDLLWPEIEGDNAYRNLVSTVARLRKLLGDREIIEHSGGLLTLNASRCWVDCWAFERLLGNSDGDAQSSKVHQALKLYNGSFLGKDPDLPWAVTMRERLRARYLRAALRQARQYDELDAWDQAIDCYERALAVEPLYEEVYRHLIQLYGRLGRHTEATSAYRRCRDTLHHQLGIRPAAETEAAYAAHARA